MDIERFKAIFLAVVSMGWYEFMKGQRIDITEQLRAKASDASELARISKRAKEISAYLCLDTQDAIKCMLNNGEI